MLARSLVRHNLGKGERNMILGKSSPNAIENPPRRVLIIRPFFLGDILLCLPVAQAIKRRWPDARITWLLREEWTDLLRSHSVVDEVIPFCQRKMHSVRAPAEFFRVMRELRQRSFDLVLNLSWDRSSAVWAWFSGAARRIGIEEYGRPRLSALLHTETVVAPERSEDRRHMADFYYQPLKLLGFEPRTEPPRISATEEEQKGVDDRLNSAFRVSRSAFVLIHPGARLKYREWPAERFAELIRALSQKTSHAIVLVCGPGEESWVSQLAEKATTIHHPPSTILFWPAPSLGEFMALAKRAALFIGNESGPMHLAAAVECRVMAIFRTDPTRWGPLGPRHRIVGGNNDLQNVTVESALDTILTALESK